MDVRLESRQIEQNDTMFCVVQARMTGGDTRCVLEISDVVAAPELAEDVEFELCWKARTLLRSMNMQVADYYLTLSRSEDGEYHWIRKEWDMLFSPEIQHEGEDEVTRKALNRMWNTYGGHVVPDEKYGMVNKFSATSLDQDAVHVVNGWDSHAYFARNRLALERGERGRVDAIIASLRRVIDEGIEDGILKEAPNSTRFSLGVTFVEGKEL